MVDEHLATRSRLVEAGAKLHLAHVRNTSTLKLHSRNPLNARLPGCYKRPNGYDPMR
jgi:hypothetical protein